MVTTIKLEHINLHKEGKDMKKIVLSTLLLTISLMSSSLASNVIKTKADTTKYNLKQYKNVILFIGDGMGTVEYLRENHCHLMW